MLQIGKLKFNNNCLTNIGKNVVYYLSKKDQQEIYNQNDIKLMQLLNFKVNNIVLQYSI